MCWTKFFFLTLPSLDRMTDVDKFYTNIIESLSKFLVVFGFLFVYKTYFLSMKLNIIVFLHLFQYFYSVNLIKNFG